MLKNHIGQIKTGAIEQNNMCDELHCFDLNIEGVNLYFEFMKVVSSELLNTGDYCYPPEYENTLTRLDIFNINVTDCHGDEIHPDLYEIDFIETELREFIENEIN